MNHNGISFQGNSAAVIAGLDRAVKQNARVITMAFGMLFGSYFVSDNITRIFDQNPKVIMVGAAGTAVSSVIFPATMDREIVTVSIVDCATIISGQCGLMKFWGYGLDQVAYGPGVDFVSVASVDGVPTTGNPSEADTTTVGGSSSATAHIAGIIALMWSRQPNTARADIITQLANASSIHLIADQQRFSLQVEVLRSVGAFQMPTLRLVVYVTLRLSDRRTSLHKAATH